MTVWKDVLGYEGKYQASNMGEIKSMSRNRKVRHKSGNIIDMPLPEKILKQQNRGKYLSVSLYMDGEQRTENIHRLIAKAFMKNPEGKFVVNHKNGNKKDNKLSNLEWNTFKENREHAIRTGLVNCRGSANKSSKLTENKVIEIKRRLLAGEQIKSIAEFFNVHKSTVSLIKLGKTWRHV